MALSRIVLDPDLRPIIDQIQAKTRSTSPSAAIALLVSRYGRHMIETWELDPSQYQTANAFPIAAASPPQPSPEFQFSDAIEL